MNNGYDFKNRMIRNFITEIHQITDISMAILDRELNLIISAGSSTAQYNLKSAIRLNGDIQAYLVAADEKSNESAFQFVGEHLEKIINDDFCIKDMSREIANLWKETNFFYNLWSDIEPTYSLESIYSIIIEKIKKIRHFENATINFIRTEEMPEKSGHDTNDIFYLIGKWVIDHNEPLLVNDIENLPHSEREKLRRITEDIPIPFAIVPLKSGYETLGLLTVIIGKQQKLIRTEDFKLLTAIGMQIGMAIKNHLMNSEIRNVEKIKKELELAARIQRMLIPKIIPQLPGHSIAGRCIPANDIGGDYFEVMKTNKTMDIVIADVSGHGIASALFMSSVRSALRSLLTERLTPAKIARKINQMVVEDAGTSGMFVTFFLARYDSVSHKMEYVNAGHNPPILIKAHSDTIHKLQLANVPAGFIDNPKYISEQVDFAQGDLLVLYTDGFIEALDDENIRYGETRFIDQLIANRTRSVNNIIDSVLESVYQFTARINQRDDMTIIAIKKGMNGDDS